MWAGNRDTIADVEEGMIIDAADILSQHEFFARGEQKGAHVGGVRNVLVGEHHLVAAPAKTQIFRFLTAVLHHPLDVVALIVGGWSQGPAIGLRHRGSRIRREQGLANNRGSADHEGSSQQFVPPVGAQVSGGPIPSVSNCGDCWSTVMRQRNRSANTLSQLFIALDVNAGVITLAAKPPVSGISSGLRGGTSGRAGR